MRLTYFVYATVSMRRRAAVSSSCIRRHAISDATGNHDTLWVGAVASSTIDLVIQTKSNAAATLPQPTSADAEVSSLMPADSSHMRLKADFGDFPVSLLFIGDDI